VFVSIFSWGISFSDRYFIEYLNGTKYVAIYSILAQVAGFGQIIGQIYNMYVTPKVLKLYEENKIKGLLYLNKMLRKLALIFIILACIVFLIPKEVYFILIERTLIVQFYYFWTFYILVIGIFLTVFQTAMSIYLVLFKKLSVLAYINGIAFVVNIIGNFWIKNYGIIAAAISTMIAYLILNIGQIIYLRKIKYENK
jgi:O-antigen/teichoic acid export membrane protein